MSIGGALFVGNSNLWAGPLGVVRIGFRGYDLGKTTTESSLDPDQDIKDIMYQQDGTKAADHVKTGVEYMFKCTLGEISTGLLLQLMTGITSKNTSESDDSGIIGRNVFTSMRASEAGVLRVASVDTNGQAQDADENNLNFYEAIVTVDGSMIQWGVDTQRNIPVTFRIKYHVFATGESATEYGAFGYWGDPTGEDVPAVVWPDVEAPTIVSAIAVSATSIEVTFDENLAFFGAGSFIAGSIAVKADDVFQLVAAAVIATTKLTLTVVGLSASDVIQLYIAGNAIEDTEATANVYQGVSDRAVTNSI